MMGDNTKRMAFGVEYLGDRYCGFQSQGGDNSIQEALLHGISSVAAHPVSLACAGRTDAGVHALNQVIHVDTTAIRSDRHWLRGVNSFLPRDVRILWVKEMDQTFHARFSAHYREYVYLMYCSPRNLFFEPHAWQVGSVDVESMIKASQYLLGEHDFHAFQSRDCQSSHAMRKVIKIEFKEERGYLLMHIRANAFVHHMVRKIVALLVAVGQGEIAPEVCQSILIEKNRAALPGQAPAKGLFLKLIGYPEEFAVPMPHDILPWTNGADSV